MQNQIKPDFINSFWEPRFPGQVPSPLVAPEVLAGDTLYLEGEELEVVELGHTDTVHTTALHVPSIGLVISGDAVYNDTPSRPREFHLEPLTDPYLSLSTHTARATH
jgi:glyoxylase-like metal-dependent hydrolase (beta-lactamase superfamily II)